MNKENIHQKLIRKMLFRMAMSCLVFASVLVFVLVVAYLICEQRIWYGDELLYPFITFVHHNLLVCFLFIMLVAVLAFSFYYIRRVTLYMSDILKSVETIYSDMESDALFSLPKPLYEVERQLNAIRTDLRLSQEAAKDAEQRKNDLIVYMAHDLKTPLTSVIGYLTLLKEEQEISPKLREKYETIALKKAQRLEELINEFFEITRFNLSKMTLELSEVDLSKMITQMVYEFLPLFKEKDLTWELNASPELLVECDIYKMERVFDNLLKNAVNYSYEHTCIEIETYEQGQQAVLVIRNHGKTIPPEKLERIFEQFFRMESSRNSSSGGAGLGLAIAKQIVELHHGTLTCESEKETITFRLVMQKKS